MPDTDPLDDLRRDVQYLKDRVAILDCVATLSRGTDRHDSGLMTDAFHRDGWDAHGTTVVEGPEFAERMNATHAAGSDATLHNITTHTCEIDGDVAHTESYVMGAILNPDGATARLLCGRYIDRLERRDGEWRIAVRHSTVEVAMTGDASLLQSPYFREFHFVKGTRDESDLSYRRPLQLDTTGTAVW
jgi:hypothetical protein